MKKDYCGPFWMPKIIRKWASLKFNWCCKIHDEDYSSSKTRLEADNAFLFNMLKECGKAPFWVPVAAWFYVWVRIGGYISYKKGQKERN